MSQYQVEVEFIAQVEQLKAQLAQAMASIKGTDASAAATGSSLDRMGAAGASAGQGVKRGAEDAGQGMRSLAGATTTASADMEGALTRLLAKLGALGLGWKALKSVFGFGEMGIQFNSAMETAYLGIGTLIAAQAKVVDGVGKELKGREALNAALALSQDQVQKLKIAGLETVATTQQLVVAYQQAVGVGLSVGMNLDQIREITIKITQAAAALGLPMNQLAEEVRDLLQGNINPRNTRIATALNITNEEVRKWKAAGGSTLADELNKRMEAFGVAGEKAAMTWSGVTSNVLEAIQTLSGAMTQPLFEGIKNGLQGALQGVFDLKNARISDAFEGLVKGGQILSEALGGLVKDALRALMEMLEGLSAWFKENQDQVRSFVTSLSNLARAGASVVEMLAGMVAKLATLPVVMKAFEWLSDLMSSSTAQVAILAAVLYGPLTSGLTQAVTAATAFVQTLRVQVALGAMEGVTGIRALIGGLQSMINPWMVAGAVILGAGVALDRWTSSASRAAQAKLDLALKTQQEAQEFATLATRAQSVDAVLRSSKSTDDQKRQAQEQMEVILAQLNAAYPGFNQYLKDEAGHQRSIAEAIEAANRASEKKLKLLLAEKESELAKARIDAAADESVRDANWFTRHSGILASKAKDSALAVEKLQREAKAYQDTLLGLQAAKAASLEPRATAPETPDQTGIISQMEIEARLAALRASSEERSTLEQQKQAALARANAEYLQEAARISKEAKEGKFDGNQAGVDALWAANIERRKAREAAINQEFADKRTQMEADLQAKLTAGEEGGLAKRLEALQKNFAAIRAEALKLRTSEWTEAQKAAQDQAILQAEQAAKERARQDQVRADLSKLKQELAELAQMKGHALSFQDQEEAMARFAARSKEAAEAVAKLREELHQNESASQGWVAGLKNWLGQAGNAFQTFKQLAGTVMNGVEQAFTRGIAGLLTTQMTFGQAMKSIWQGLVQTVAQAVGQIVARWVAMAIAKKLLGLQENAADGGRTAASLVTATAETWAAYAGIPFAGPILAAAQIATMYASMAASTGLATAAGTKVTAMAVGSRVDNPTLALIGEAGPEVVAPERSFLDWARHLFGMGANLQANISRNDRMVQDYSLKGASIASEAGSYARAGTAGGGGAEPYATYHLSFPGAQILDTSDRGMERLGNMAIDAIQLAARRRGQVLAPGTAGASF